MGRAYNPGAGISVIMRDRLHRAIEEIRGRIPDNPYLRYIESIRDPDMSSTILIQIAVYRDMNLLDTIYGALAQAAWPGRIRFAICLQDVPERAHILDGIPGVKYVFVDEKDADGPCVARRACQEMYDGEDFVLHTDGHMRFAKFWDVALIQNWRECRDENGFLTEYCLSNSDLWDEPFDSDMSTETATYGHPICIGCKGFWNTQFVYMIPNSLVTAQYTTVSPRVYWVSAHMTFMPGYIDQTVPFDPHMFFYGDEQPMSARYFTYGFNAYAPTASCMFHMYRGHVSPDAKARSDLPNSKKDIHGKTRSKEEVLRIEQLYGLRDNGYADLAVGAKYGLGKARTFAEYEAFCGLDFANRRVRNFCKRAMFSGPHSEKDLVYVDYMAPDGMKNSVLDKRFDPMTFRMEKSVQTDLVKYAKDNGVPIDILVNLALCEYLRDKQS